MANYNLHLESLITTNTKAEPRYLYVDNVKTDQIECYLYKLIDMTNAQILSIKVPIEKEFSAETYIKAVTPVGTPYLNKQNNRIGFSIRADDLVAEK
ncbi:hypothetical protein HED42_14440 [Enterococcus casseliflavus]|uniref:hypothetical protein n=1 Tax=Enterococcus casseliflavus TaxID=37734 RepID=UPI001432FD3F|nr:hypothetical protein [Enterococcus casseliflavus]NKD39340.1 hypothetical protein [Enterococcus casseliflavus]